MAKIERTRKECVLLVPHGAILGPSWGRLGAVLALGSPSWDVLGRLEALNKGLVTKEKNIGKPQIDQ